MVGEAVLEVCIRSCWVIQIPQCSTGGQMSCDIMIYHSPVKHGRSERVSTRGPLTEKLNRVHKEFAQSLRVTFFLKFLIFFKIGAYAHKSLKDLFLQNTPPPRKTNEESNGDSIC